MSTLTQLPSTPAPVRVAIVGGGPAGLMAAEQLATAGAAVTVYDAMPSVGRKFLLAGRGGLNLTHSEALEPFLSRYGVQRERLTPMLHVFGAQALQDWAHGLGVDTFVGSSGRIFPKEMKAAPLLRAWLTRLRAAGVRFEMRHRWLGWEDAMMEAVLVSGIAYDKDQARVTVCGVPDRPGVSAALFAPLSENGIMVDMIIQTASREGVTDMTFTVSRKDLEKAIQLMKEIVARIGGTGVEHDPYVAKVSVIGVGMRNHTGVATKAFAALQQENINIQMISTSEIKISCLIDEKYTELAVRTLHDAFELHKPDHA